MKVEIETVAPIFLSWEICFKVSSFCLCSVPGAAVADEDPGPTRTYYCCWLKGTSRILNLPDAAVADEDPGPTHTYYCVDE